MKFIIGELSELLRQIAVTKYGRETCASLAGQSWLVWLSEHDPKKFAWTQYSEILLQAPYAPEQTEAMVDKKQELYHMITAAKQWVRK